MMVVALMDQRCRAAGRGSGDLGLLPGQRVFVFFESNMYIYIYRFIIFSLKFLLVGMGGRGGV